MRKVLPFICLLLATPLLLAAPAPATPPAWQTKVTHDLPLLGHRNWILIVDSAYPLQSSPGVETIDTNAEQLDVLRYVMGAIGGSIHVRPDIFMDAELPFLTEDDTPGIDEYRTQVGKLLDGLNVESVPHEKMIGDVDEAGKLVHVLILKTRLAMPYTSVFLRLNCKYWSDDAEERLRVRMANAAPSTPSQQESPTPQPQLAPPTPQP